MDFKNLLRNPKLYYHILIDKLSYNLDDKTYLNRQYKRKFDKNIDFENPKTFNEKLQWLKLYDRNPLYTTLVDKYKVKKWVSDKIGQEYVIPVFGVWNRFNEIDFSKLPNQFVLKTNHGSGGVVICRSKVDNEYFSREGKRLSLCNVKRLITKSLKENYYLKGREWPYKNVERKIFAEKFMIDESGYELKDYKFYCFNGVPEYVLVASERHKGVKFDYFDINFEHVDCRPEDNATTMPQKPKNYDEMVTLSRVLSQNIPHVRVDWYNVDGKIYFGELTFFDSGGLEDKREWDVVFGNMIDLSKAYSNKRV